MIRSFASGAENGTGADLHTVRSRGRDGRKVMAVPDISSLNFEAGRIYWGAIRDAVTKCQFQGHDVKLWEGRGFISREFIIKGEPVVVQQIANWLGRISA